MGQELAAEDGRGGQTEERDEDGDKNEQQQREKKVAKAKKSVSERVRCRNKNLLPFPTSPFFIDSALTRAAHVHNIMERGGGKTGGGGKCEGEARWGEDTKTEELSFFFLTTKLLTKLKKKLQIFFPESG